VVYWTSYSSGVLIPWDSWQSLSGTTLSAPAICEYNGLVAVIVKGTDNGIYEKDWSSSGGWSSTWSSPGGSTIDQPACALFGNVLYVVVRGSDNELYWNTLSISGHSWSTWKDLSGKSASAPVLVFPFLLNRLDLFIQGTDNGIYHKAFTGGCSCWSSVWDSPGGSTSSPPTAALFTKVTGCPSCLEEDAVLIVVRGTDNSIYTSYYEITPFAGWSTWFSLSGATLSAPTLAYYDNGCFPGVGTNCGNLDALAVQGTDNAVYHKTFSPVTGWSGWDSPGGSISNSPALAYVANGGEDFLLLVQGNPSSNLYANTVTGSTWTGYSSVGGATNSDPALTAIV